MIRIHDIPARLAFALAVACFGIAGVTNTTMGASGRIALPVASAVTGTFLMARYAQRASRKRLATVAVACWCGFLLLAAVHAVGLGSFAALAPSPAPITLGAVDGATWSTLLVAGTATLFLAFREYGNGATVEVAEDRVLDGDAEY